MATGGKRKRSRWIIHVMDTHKANAGKAFKDILKMAAKTYKKSPETKKRHTNKRKKRHHKGKTCKKGKKGKKCRKNQSGGVITEGTLGDHGAAAAPSPVGDAGTALSGNECTLPQSNGSGSITGSDLAQCKGYTIPAPFYGGRKKRKASKKRRKKRGKKRGKKSRKKGKKKGCKA